MSMWFSAAHREEGAATRGGRSGFKDGVAFHGALMGIDVEPGQTVPGEGGVRADRQAVEGRAGQRHADAAPPSRARVRDPGRTIGRRSVVSSLRGMVQWSL